MFSLLATRTKSSTAQKIYAKGGGSVNGQGGMYYFANRRGWVWGGVGMFVAECVIFYK